MKRKIIFVLAVSVVIAAGLFAYTNNSKNKPLQDANLPEQPQAESALNGQQEAPSFEIPAEAQQKIGVKTTEAKVVSLEKTIRANGQITADETKVVAVSTKFDGWIERLHANYTGMFVKKGQPIAEIYSPELLAAQEEFLVALRWAKSEGEASKDSAQLLEGARRRLRLLDIDEGDIKKIEESRRAMRTMTIYSPASGYITEKMALEGARVMAGERLMSIADLSTIWVLADIYEYEIGLLKEGQRAEIRLSYLPGEKFISKVEFIYPTLAKETRTAKIRLSLPNPKLVLKPQMFTEVEIKIDLGKRLVIPEDAVIDTGERQVVYVDKGDGYFEPRQIMTGLREAGMREVLAGLKPGEKVVSSAAFLVDSEAQLKGISPLELPKEHRH